jgi:hypothetical protein
MIRLSQAHQNGQAYRGDRAHRRAERSLKIALSQHSNGSLATMAACARGRPSVITTKDIWFYQIARSIVHDGNGSYTPADVEVLAAFIRRRSRVSRWAPKRPVKRRPAG